MPGTPNLSYLNLFAGIIALAALAQCAAMIILCARLRSLSVHLDGLSKDLLRRVDSAAQKANEMFVKVESVVAGAEAIRDNLIHSTAVVRNRVTELDSFVAETTRKAELQVAYLQDFLDTSRLQMEQTFALVQRSVLTPVQEVGALAAGFRVGLDVLLGRRKRPVDRFQHDDGMFI